MDIMIGLDMLKRHRCCINLAENVLQVGDYARVPFLPESELPHFAKLSLDRGAQPGTNGTERVGHTVFVYLFFVALSLCCLLYNESVFCCSNVMLRTAFFSGLLCTSAHVSEKLTFNLI